MTNNVSAKGNEDKLDSTEADQQLQSTPVQTGKGESTAEEQHTGMEKEGQSIKYSRRKGRSGESFI